MYSISQASTILAAFAVCVVAYLYSAELSQLFPVSPKMLSVEEQQILLKNLVYMAKPEQNPSTKRNKVAFCCSADLDVSVQAIDLMSKINDKHGKGKLIPQHHERIESFQELIESFSHYFSQGAAAEQSMSSATDFHHVVELANSIPKVRHSLGGNAATMAQRAALEGGQVLLGAAVGTNMKNRFYPNVTVVGHIEPHEHEDIHLVLEYAKGDRLNGIVSPRANRYYLNHDVYNARLSVLEEFDQSLDAFEADLVVIGGLQLMEVDTNETRRLSRLQELSNVLQVLHLKNVPTHFEFAAASDFQLFNDTVELVLPYVNSIGLNEQELHILHHYLLSNEEAITTTSRPTVAQVVTQISQMLQHIANIKQNKKQVKNYHGEALIRLNRIHFHTLQFHIMCQSKSSPWSNPNFALVQSALMSTKLACGDSTNGNRSFDMRVDPDRVEVLLPRTSELHHELGLKLEIDPHKPITEWEEYDFKCSIVPMLACKKPDHTAGLGDNISGTGMAYHVYDKQ